MRTRRPDERLYTFWDTKRGRWGRDAGLRIDHLLLSPAIAGRLVSAGVDRDVRGREGASDHAPTLGDVVRAEGDGRQAAAEARQGSGQVARVRRETSAREGRALAAAWWRVRRCATDRRERREKASR